MKAFSNDHSTTFSIFLSHKKQKFVDDEFDRGKDYKAIGKLTSSTQHSRVGRKKTTQDLLQSSDIVLYSLGNQEFSIQILFIQTLYAFVKLHLY